MNLPLASCAALGKLLNLSEAHVEVGVISSKARTHVGIRYFMSLLFLRSSQPLEWVWWVGL